MTTGKLIADLHELHITYQFLQFNYKKGLDSSFRLLD